jgi:hypothetical protein
MTPKRKDYGNICSIPARHNTGVSSRTKRDDQASDDYFSHTEG